MARWWFSSVVVIVALEPARADVRGRHEPIASHFSTLDRFDEVSQLGIELGSLRYEFPEGIIGPEPEPPRAYRFDLHGHYIDRDQGAGVYVECPMTRVGAGSRPATGVGNPEAGLLFVPRLQRSDIAFVLRAGGTFAFSSRGRAANAFGGLMRPADLYLGLPGAKSVRGSVSLLYRQDALFARVDVGLDYNFTATPSDPSGPPVKINAGLRLDVGGGFVIAPISFAVESVNTCDAETGDCFDTLGLSARYIDGLVHPYVGFSTPLDALSRQYISSVLIAGLVVELP